MKVDYKKNGSKEVFFIEEEGKQIGEIIFSVSGDQMLIEHTEVEEAYRNNDVGQVLVEKSVEYAREKNYKIIPQCPFARAIIEKNESMQDVLA